MLSYFFVGFLAGLLLVLPAAVASWLRRLRWAFGRPAIRPVQTSVPGPPAAGSPPIAVVVGISPEKLRECCPPATDGRALWAEACSRLRAAAAQFAAAANWHDDDGWLAGKYDPAPLFEAARYLAEVLKQHGPFPRRPTPQEHQLVLHAVLYVNARTPHAGETADWLMVAACAWYARQRQVIDCPN